MKTITSISILLLVTVFSVLYFPKKGVSMDISSTIKQSPPEDQSNYAVAYLGGGCFWCLESQLRSIEGVLYTRAGYQGGKTQSPTYNNVTSGNTGHAETVEVIYNPELLNYEDLIKFFLTKGHDATQINRQGVDVGTQYRSAIFYNTEEEKKSIERIIKKIDDSEYYGATPIATEISPLDNNKFWVAEDYHQQYYEKYEESTGRPHIRVLLKKEKKEFK